MAGASVDGIVHRTATATALVRTAGSDGLWPDPVLYVHLGVMFLAGTRVRPGGLVAMCLVLVGLSVAIFVVDPGSPGSPTLGETVGLAAVTTIAAGAVHARDRALHDLVPRQATFATSVVDLNRR